jgi:hypothetical protein
MTKLSLRSWFITFALASVSIVPTLVRADDPATDTLGDGEYVNKDVSYYMNDIQGNTRLGGYDDIANEGPIITASRVINFLLLLLGTIALCLTVYAGYLWIWSRGNEEDITKAKDILAGSVIGILLILSSYAIMNYIFRSFVDITD